MAVAVENPPGTGAPIAPTASRVDLDFPGVAWRTSRPASREVRAHVRKQLSELREVLLSLPREEYQRHLDRFNELAEIYNGLLRGE